MVEPVLERLPGTDKVKVDLVGEAKRLRGAGPVDTERPGAAEEFAPERKWRVGRGPYFAVALFLYQRQYCRLGGYLCGGRCDRGLDIRIQCVPYIAEVDPVVRLIIRLLAGRVGEVRIAGLVSAGQLVVEVPQVLDVAVLETDGQGHDGAARQFLFPTGHAGRRGGRIA